MDHSDDIMSLNFLDELMDVAPISDQQEAILLKEDEQESAEVITEKLQQVSISSVTLPSPVAEPKVEPKMTYRYCRPRNKRLFKRTLQARLPRQTAGSSQKTHPPSLLKMKVSCPSESVKNKIPKSLLYRSLEPDGKWVIVCFKCKEKGHKHYNCPNL